MRLWVLAVSLVAISAAAGEISLAFRKADFTCDDSYQLQQIVLIKGGDTKQVAKAKTIELPCDKTQLLRTDIENFLNKYIDGNGNYRWRGRTSMRLFTGRELDSTLATATAGKFLLELLRQKFPGAMPALKLIDRDICRLPSNIEITTDNLTLPRLKLGVTRYPVGITSTFSGKSQYCSVWFEISVTTDAVIAARPLKPGDSLTAADLRIVQRDQLRHPQQFSPVSALIGNALVAHKRDGELITRHDVRPIQDVADGQQVAYLMQRGMVEISGKAIALAGGRVGDVIRIVLMESNSVINALITGKGEVRIDASL